MRMRMKIITIGIIDWLVNTPSSISTSTRAVWQQFSIFLSLLLKYLKTAPSVALPTIFSHSE